MYNIDQLRFGRQRACTNPHELIGYAFNQAQLSVPSDQDDLEIKRGNEVETRVCETKNETKKSGFIHRLCEQLRYQETSEDVISDEETGSELKETPEIAPEYQIGIHFKDGKGISQNLEDDSQVNSNLQIKNQ